MRSLEISSRNCFFNIFEYFCSRYRVQVRYQWARDTTCVWSVCVCVNMKLHMYRRVCVLHAHEYERSFALKINYCSLY